ncbi:Histidine N-acetyltransferase [Channa argus]|uniref:Histidine N-acetyltransferase n=1 Tax=Channa argus TaxID=215402 RepID=A0A6G1PQ64_CHAAH|nr:Histidine N-acetyltransferase [Channa argus]KAK2909664.1 hypothetical protein Q8A73_007379 [Channa argus]
MSSAGEAWDVEYSFAQEQDFQQVVNLCDKDDYYGMDYMAATFHRWLQEPGRLMFIAKMKDRVVALESTLLVDGGHTVLIQGLRVTPELRGCGISRALQQYAMNYIRQHFPDVCTVRQSRGDHLSAQVLAKYRVIAKEAVLSLGCEVIDLGPFIAELQSRLPLQTPSSPCCPVTLNQQQVETLILTNHVVSNLLPGKTIISNWEPLKPMKANMEVLSRRRLTWIADNESEPNALSLCTPSYSVPYRQDAIRITINIFGRSLASVCAVFVAQLKAMLPSLRGYLIIGVFVDPMVWPGLQQFCHNNANVCFFRDYYQSTMLETDL